MTDDRPRPKYGEYAPIGTVPPGADDVAVPDVAVEPTSPDHAPAATPSPRRNRDIAATAALLLVGVFDVVNSFPRFNNLASVLREVYDQQGFGKFTADELANDMGVAINVTRAVLLIAAIGLGLWRLGRGKIAWWIPLVAAALAFIVMCVCLLVVMLTDPALAEYVLRQSPTP